MLDLTISNHFAGIPGALAAALGIVTPTVAIIIVLALVLVSFQDNLYVQAAFKGIRPVIVALIAMAAYKMGKTSVKDKLSWAVCLLAGVTLFLFKNLNLIFFIIAGAFLGVTIFKIKDLIQKVG